MKKVVALVLTLMLTVFVLTPTYATESNYTKADQLSENTLIAMAQLNIDQRSDAAKKAVDIEATAKRIGITKNLALNAEVYVVTLLEDRVVDEDGAVIETYSTTAVTPRSSKTETNGSQAGAVYARVNYTIKVEGTGTVGRLDSTSHMTVNNASTATSMLKTNSIFRNYDTGENRNSSTTSSPSSNTWYSLSSRTSSYFSTMSLVMGASTTGYFTGANSVYVECLVEG